MAVNDLSNKEQLLLNYLREMGRQEFPNLDLSDHGAFMEMFGMPQVKLLLPLVEFADRVKLTQSLENAELMTEEEMNELGAAFFESRDPGDYSIGQAVLSFDDLPGNGVLQVPAGTEATSKQGYRYRSTETVILDETELPNYYDPDTFEYNIPVMFQAENPGKAYDIEENELTSLVSQLPNFVRMTNDIPFRGGKDKETNREFADRIIATGGAPNVGVERGWRRFIEQFPEAEDVIVAGFSHPLMQRDVVGTAPPGRFSSQVSPDVHWGGKVDLHIRGRRLVEAMDTGILQKNDDGDLYVMLSQHPTYDILEIEFATERISDPELDESYFIVRDFLLMKEEDREKVGTLYETSWVVIKDDRLMEGDVVYVRYRYNALFNDIEEQLYLEENRPPASDVLLKEARRKFIHGAVVVRLENSQVGINERERGIIRQRLYNYVRDLPTGGEVQFSDLSAPIYGDLTTIDAKVDYISLPSQYLITDQDNKFLYYCLNQEKRDLLQELESQSLYFSQWIPYYQDRVTLYDFFDVMHVLTYQNAEKNAWKNLAMRDHEWGKKVYYVDMAKRMMAYVNNIHRLSPSKWKSEENDYFELGYLAIFDDDTYTLEDLDRIVTLFMNIANPIGDEADDSVDNLLHLVVYCSVILYLLTADNIGGMSVKDISDWLIDLTKGTPIDYQVHN